MTRDYSRREILGFSIFGAISLPNLIILPKSYGDVWMVAKPVGEPKKVLFREGGINYVVGDVDGDGIIDKVEAEGSALNNRMAPYIPHSSVLEERIRNQKRGKVEKVGYSMRGIYNPDDRQINRKNPNDPWFTFVDDASGEKVNVFEFQTRFDQLRK